MFYSRLWHKLKMVLCQETEARKAMKDGMGREGGRDWEGKAVSPMLPVSAELLHLREGGHKTPL